MREFSQQKKKGLIPSPTFFGALSAKQQKSHLLKYLLILHKKIFHFPPFYRSVFNIYFPFFLAFLLLFCFIYLLSQPNRKKFKGKKKVHLIGRLAATQVLCKVSCAVLCYIFTTSKTFGKKNLLYRTKTNF